MRIMSYNILCYGSGENVRENRIHKVIDTIKKYHPDSLGVQEATPEWMTDLKRFLTDYDCVGIGRDDGKNEGEHSAIFYLKDKYEVIDSGNFWLSETPDIPSFGWDAKIKRICTWAKFKNKETGKCHAHVNVHLDHISFQAQMNGAKMVMKKAETFDVPTFVTGDFNVNQGEEVYNEMIKFSLKDSKFVAEDTMDNITFNNFTETGTITIDYVFVSKDVKVKKYRVVTDKIDGNYPSDHFPVYSDVEIV